MKNVQFSCTLGTVKQSCLDNSSNPGHDTEKLLSFEMLVRQRPLSLHINVELITEHMGALKKISETLL